MWKWIAVVTLAMIGQSWAQEDCIVCPPTPTPPWLYTPPPNGQAMIDEQINRNRQELIERQIDQQQQDIEKLQQQQRFNQWDDPYP